MNFTNYDKSKGGGLNVLLGSIHQVLHQARALDRVADKKVGVTYC